MQLRKKNHIISQEFISFEDKKKPYNSILIDGKIVKKKHI